MSLIQEQHGDQACDQFCPSISFWTDRSLGWCCLVRWHIHAHDGIFSLAAHILTLHSMHPEGIAAQINPQTDNKYGGERHRIIFNIRQHFFIKLGWSIINIIQHSACSHQSDQSLWMHSTRACAFSILEPNNIQGMELHTIFIHQPAGAIFFIIIWFSVIWWFFIKIMTSIVYFQIVKNLWVHVINDILKLYTNNSNIHIYCSVLAHNPVFLSGNHPAFAV